MKRSRVLILVLCIAVSSVALVCAGGCGGGNKEEALVIGITVGKASVYGQNSERSAVLAAEEINNAGGVDIGGKKHLIKLEIVDTRDEEPGVPTSDVLLTVEKLLLEKKVDAVTGGPSMSECSMALLDLYAKYKVPNIVASGTWSPAWSKKVGEDVQKYKYSFRLSGHVGYWAADAGAILEQINEQYGFDKLYVSCSDAAHTVAAAKAIKESKKGEYTDLFRLAEKHGKPHLTSAIWAKALAHEDPLATELLDRAVTALSAGIASAINLFDPDAVVIGGGLGIRFGDTLVPKIVDGMGEHLFDSDNPPPVKVAALGDEGGVIGASLLLEQTI